MKTTQRSTPSSAVIMTLLVLTILCVRGMSDAAAQSSGGFDTNLPLEIQADSLEIQQANLLAIFTGNVEVEQGELIMRSDKLVVHYSEKNTAKSDAPANIRKIDATGSVFLSSPRETAQGDIGTYDVVNKRVDLKGNVVLTQGKNVLRGDKMTLDLITGKSRVEGGSTSGSNSGRVRGIFVPEKKTNQ